MATQALPATLAENRKKPVLVGAAVVLIALALMGIFLAGRSKEYESTASLAYAGVEDSSVGTTLPTAAAVASEQLTDARLSTLITSFHLYSGSRKETASNPDVEQLRSQITITQRAAGSLQIAFRDADGAKSQAVTNAMADVLANSSANPNANSTIPGPASAAVAVHAPVPVAIKKPGAKKSTIPGRHAAVDKSHLQREAAQNESKLDELKKKQNALEQESDERRNQIAAIASSHGATVEPAAPPAAPVDPVAGTRAALKQQIAAEKQRLAGLKDRYTDAYPDVQDAKDNVATLEGKLAALPPPPPPEVKHAPVANLYEKQLDALTLEESQIGERLRANEKDIAQVQQRREQLKTQIAAAASEVAAAPVALEAPSPAEQAMMVLRASAAPVALPLFRIVQRATTGEAISTYNTQLYFWSGVGLVVLVVLCFAPLVPVRTASGTHEGAAVQTVAVANQHEAQDGSQAGSEESTGGDLVEKSDNGGRREP